MDALQTPSLYRRLALVCILGSAALLLFEAGRQDAWIDEGFNVRRIQAPWRLLYHPFADGFDPRADPFDRRSVFDFNPPLYFALLRAALGSDPSLLAVRGASIAGFMLGLLSLARWTARALDPRARSFMVLVYVLSPALLYYGVEARPYMLPVGFAMFCLGLLWANAAHPRRLFGIGLALSLCGSLMNFHCAWLVIVLACSLCILAFRRNAWMSRAGALAGLSGLILGALLAVAAVLPQRGIFLLARGGAPSDPINFDTFNRMMALPVAGPYTTVDPRLQPVALALRLAILILMLILIVYGASRLRASTRAATGSLALALWLGPLFLILLARVWLGYPLNVRYAIFGLPGWLMFATWVAREAADDRAARRRWPLLALAGLLSIGAAMDAFTLVHPTRQAWKPAIRELAQNATDGDFYAFDPDQMKDAFAVNAGRPPAAKYLYLDDATTTTQGTVWVFVSKSPTPKTLEFFNKNGFSLTNRIQGSVSLWQAQKSNSASD